MIDPTTKIYHPELSMIAPEAKIGANGKIHCHVWIGPKVKIGNRCKIEAKVFIPDFITIGDDVFIGPGVIFTNDKHPPSGGKSWMTTIVEDGVSIGAGAVIGPGVTLGKNCMIGMGAVVTKNIPSGEIWVGNPARFFKKANQA